MNPCEGKHIFTQLQEAEKMDTDDPMTLARPSREEAAELIKKAREGMEKQLKGKMNVRIFYAGKIFQVFKKSKSKGVVFFSSSLVYI